MRKNTKAWMLVPVAVLAAACSGNGSKTDEALKADLALASQAQPYAAQYMSPLEQGQNPYNPYGYNPYVAQQYQTAQRVAPAPVRRVATTTRRASSSAGTVRAEQPTRVIKHTKRDAAIGAAAGAVIGAVASRDKVKGGLIGAAVGGVLGAVIGNNVDVKRVPY
jgi:uncharacterized protein YcfJ